MARSQAVILDAAVALLAEHGVGGLSVEAVAARAGVGKATVYRHWPTRARLVLAAIESLLVDEPAPDTGNLLDDLALCLAGVIGVCSTPPLSSVLPSLIDASERDAELAALHHDFSSRRRVPLRAVLDRAAARGDLKRGLDLDVLADVIVGPLFYRRLVRRQPPDEAYVEQVLALLRPVLAAPA